MKTIYKYAIKSRDKEMYVELPSSARVISYLNKEGGLGCVYAVVESTDYSIEEREVLFLGTGWELDQETVYKMMYYKFLGTHTFDNYLVWHIWIQNYRYNHEEEDD